MKELFFDSSGIFAWADKSSRHAVAIEKIILAGDVQLVTTNIVVCETLSLVTKRVSKVAGLKLGEILFASRLLEIVTVDERLQKQGWNLYKSYKDKDFDLVDAISFSLCRKRRITGAITLDRHFVQMGLRVFPERQV